MHDASEAYLGDLPKPIKDMLPGYKRLEKKVMECISLKFGFKYPFCSEIHQKDKMALEYEWKHYMLGDGPFFGWNYEQAYKSFLVMYHTYKNSK